MGSGTWRKAYGALKDSTKVGLANFNSEYKVSPARASSDRTPCLHTTRDLRCRSITPQIEMLMNAPCV
jgi:hypothetical protein